jgi:hypothetical protein
MVRPAKSAADYMAVAVCPALIMVLVGSLVFYLIQIGYSGEWVGRLQWTLFWFVFAMVLVSRIAIEQSRGASFGYGLALAAATSIMLSRYLGFLWGAWLLLALIWWACNKIVWDCTFIDEDQDASGKGLLQVTRFQDVLRPRRAQVRAVPGPESGPGRASAPGDPERAGPVPASFGQSQISNSRLRAAQADRFTRPKAKARDHPRNKQKMHAPGLQVLYFSMAAVPVFGLGELLLKSDDVSGKRICFFLLFTYLASALGLLLLTSFLGLRRYLRQRYLVMPAAIARIWVTSGGALLLSVLALALLLPRPATPYSLAAIVTRVGSPRLQASKQAPSEAQGAEGRSRQKAPDTRPQSTQTEANRGGAKGTPRPTSGQPGNSGPKGSRSGIPSPVPGLVTQFQKWVSYLLVAVVLLVAVYRFAPLIRQWISGLSMKPLALTGIDPPLVTGTDPRVGE